MQDTSLCPAVSAELGLSNWQLILAEPGGIAEGSPKLDLLQKREKQKSQSIGS